MLVKTVKCYVKNDSVCRADVLVHVLSFHVHQSLFILLSNLANSSHQLTTHLVTIAFLGPRKNRKCTATARSYPDSLAKRLLKVHGTSYSHVLRINVRCQEQMKSCAAKVSIFIAGSSPDCRDVIHLVTLLSPIASVPSLEHEGPFHHVVLRLFIQQHACIGLRTFPVSDRALDEPSGSPLRYSERVS